MAWVRVSERTRHIAPCASQRVSTSTGSGSGGAVTGSVAEDRGAREHGSADDAVVVAAPVDDAAARLDGDRVAAAEAAAVGPAHRALAAGEVADLRAAPGQGQLPVHGLLRPGGPVPVDEELLGVARHQ